MIGHSARSGLTLALLCVGAFVGSLDATVVAVALPTIARDLSADLTDLQWIVDGYLLAVACLLLCAGSIGDATGRKHVYLIGLSGFTTVSALCAVAPNLGVLIAARAGQGAFGAALLAVSLALTSAVYTEPAARARAIGIWAGVGALGLAVGPVLGGGLIAQFGWRSIFWINVPIGLATVLPLARLLPAQPARSHRLDLVGQILFTVGTLALTYALIEANRRGWTSAGIVVTLVTSVVALLLFAAWERQESSPMLPPRLLRVPAISVGGAVNFLGLAALIPTIFLLTLYFQDVRGLSAAATGVRLLPLTIPMMIGSLVAPSAAVRWGTRRMILAGSALTTSGLGGLFVALGSDWAVGEWATLALVGFGVPLAVAPATVAALGHAPADLVATTAGAMNTFRQLGGVAGIALVGLLLPAGSTFVAGMRTTIAVAAMFALLTALAAVPIRKPVRGTEPVRT